MGGGGGGKTYNMPLYASFSCGAFSTSFAELCTIPLDTAKVRLQLQAGAKATGPLKYNGMLGTMATVAREEGVGALWKGITPGVHRQILFGGLRIGLYEPIKNMVTGGKKENDNLLTKIAAGLLTGAGGIAVASPTDLVKVRMQAQGQLPPGTPPKYTSALNCYATILREEGLAAMWTGVGPNMLRNAVINAAELATYDQVKQAVLASGLVQDGIACHLISGLGAGFCAVCVGSPVDVVKSRVMGDSTGKYKGTLDCFIKTATQDGILAFYKGFLPNFGRLGSWNVIMFLTLEQVKARVGPLYDPQ
mmetsp:Transcript_11234/g.41128  ORF Transcript_11234/g.41128 Transcript_11234/m.41128 type:complete len:306 (+) Transcript_11234:81-998(+)